MPNCRKAGLMCVVYLSVLKSSSWLVWYLKNSYVVIFFFFWAMSSLVYIPVYWKGMLYFLLTSRKFVICYLGGPYMSVLRRSRLAVHHTSWYIKMECYILYILLIYSFVICFFFFFGPFRCSSWIMDWHIVMPLRESQKSTKRTQSDATMGPSSSPASTPTKECVSQVRWAKID